MIAQNIVHTLIRRKQTVSIAESCTGGMISSLLTDIPGASRCFKGSAIIYTAKAKESLLSIPKHVIREYTEVSLYTTYRLAVNIRQRLLSDFAIAITGYLGPGGGTRAHPKGTVCIVGISKQRTVCKILRLTASSRTKNKKSAAAAALSVLYRLVSTYPT